MRKKLTILTLMLSAFIVCISAIMLYFGKGVAIDLLFNENWDIGLHLSIGLALSVAISILLLSNKEITENQKCSLFLALLAFCIYAVTGGYVTIVIAVIPTWFAFYRGKINSLALAAN